MPGATPRRSRVAEKAGSHSVPNSRPESRTRDELWTCIDVVQHRKHLRGAAHRSSRASSSAQSTNARTTGRAEMRLRRHEEVAPRRAPALLRHAHELAARELRRDVRAAAERDAEPRDGRADQHDRVRELRAARGGGGVEPRALEPRAPAHPRLLGMRVDVVQQRVAPRARPASPACGRRRRGAGSRRETAPRRRAARRAGRGPGSGAKRIARSRSSRLKSASVRLVRSTTSTRGARSWKRCRRGSSQPFANAASVVSVSTPPARCVAEPRRRLAEQIEPGRQLGQIVAAFLRQHEPAREALEQRRVEVALEPPHLLAHGGSADVQLGGGGDEAAEPRRGFESAQGVQRRQASGHG